MAIAEYVELFDHTGHKKQATVYDVDTPDERQALVCLTCSVVLSDSNSHRPDQVTTLQAYYTQVSPDLDLWESIKEEFPVTTDRPCTKCGSPMNEILAYLLGDKRLCGPCKREAGDKE